MISGEYFFHKKMLSVVMSVYNGEDFLNQAIDSVLSQSYDNFEFIIVNDGSTDSSLEIISKYKDRRIRVINKVNSGLIDSLNLGIRSAVSDWIVRMDADDICFPNRFELLSKGLKENVALIVSDVEFIYNNDGVNQKRKYYKSYLNKTSLLNDLNKLKSRIIHPSVVISRKHFEKVGGYYSNFKGCEDFDLFFRLAKSGDVVFINKACLYYRIHENSVSRNFRLSKETFLNSLLSYYCNQGSYDIDYDKKRFDLEIENRLLIWSHIKWMTLRSNKQSVCNFIFLVLLRILREVLIFRFIIVNKRV